ncbi:ATP-binding cassette sub-family A member 2-like [Ptychodera flava]|uniref:ATP-binding cassette sub-family A member 2-like n=1 Tax=Ptychodera flava TaxID=63121 RepID=UPI003969CF58
MGFLHQLRLLLWKNFTLKKRMPVVVTFELVIPLVLFFILTSIRMRKPSEPKPQDFFYAQPLPSAGIIPLLQSFCPDGERDPYGFPNYPDSMVHQFLNKVRRVVLDNKLFDQDFTIDDIQILPDAFKDVLTDKDSIEERFASADDFTLGSVLKNESKFKDYLMTNLSLPLSSVNKLLKYKISAKELYRILYGVSPVKAESKNGAVAGASSWSLKRWLHHRLAGLKHGLLLRNLSHPGREFTKDELIGILSQTISVEALSPNWQQFDPIKYSDNVKNTIVNATVLRDISCHKNEVYKFLEVPDDQRNETDIVQQLLCESAPSLVESLANELRQDLDSQAIANKLNLSRVNYTKSRAKVARILNDLEKYAVFDKTVEDVSSFASLLPSDACPGEQNDSVVPYEQFTFNKSDFLYGNISDDYFDLASLNQTQDDLTTNPELLKLNEDSNPKLDEKTKKLVHLYKVWGSMQNVLCGINSTIDESALNKGNLDAAGFTHYQEKNLQVLVHLLFNNPKILYAPNTTDVNDLIYKASSLIQLAQNITYFATTWLNYSQEIREHLQKNTTVESYQWLRQMTVELKEHPDLLRNRTVGRMVRAMIENGTIPDIGIIEEKLHIIDNAACAWIEIMSKAKLDIFKPFSNETQLVDYVLNKAYSDNVTVFASVVFEVDKNGKLPPHVVYKIRQNSTFTDRNTNVVRNKYWAPGSNHWHSIRYYQFGFVLVQDIIERAIIDKRVGRSVMEPGIYVHEDPYPCFIRDQFIYVIEHMFPIVMIISWVYYVAMLTQNIVYEKEQRLKEVMKIMGLSSAVHWVAWFITSLFEMSITITSLVCILKYGKVLTYSNSFIVWLFLMVFAVATTMYCFMVSALFSKAKLAAACAGILYFISYVPYLYIALREEVVSENVPVYTKSLASVLSTTAFGIGSKYFSLYEEQGVGIQWHNFNQSPLEEDKYNLFHVIMIMIGDAVMYAVLTWYIEAVHPGSYGLPRPWYFPFQKSYWFGHGTTESNQVSFTTCFRRRRYSPLSVMEEDQACAMAAASQEEANRYVEEEPVHLPLGVCINGLVKVYKNSNKPAVNKLSLNFYEGQITSFLGHNGAGKTTTMSILTGLIPPTAGTAVIYEHDIRTDMLQIRQSLGMCPQHNALFDKLTVEEHVWFYASLKESSSSDIDKEMDVLIKDIGLHKKRNSKVDTLSGGMQRKLSVAIAFVGGSRMVILDEPTAGVDPYARRAIWDLLLKYKHGRTIILSTHHMDEADMLGDRIAIIANGQLKCCGSSLFLKSTYGDGYKLTIVKKPAARNCVSMSMENLVEFSDSEDDEEDRRRARVRAEIERTKLVTDTKTKVTNFIHRHISGAVLASENNHELSYILPSEAAKKGCFEKLFEQLSEQQDELGVSSYGLMDTALEEVFLKVTESHASHDALSDLKESGNKPEETSNTLPSEYDMSPPTSPLFGRPDSPLRNFNAAVIPSPSRGQSSTSPPGGQSSTTQSLTSPPREVELSNVSEGLGASSSDSDVSLQEVYNRQQGEIEPLLRNTDSEYSDGTDRDKLHGFEGTGSYTLTGLPLRMTQFTTLLLKRFHHTKRNWKGLFSQLFLPAVFICIAMTVALLAPQIGNLPPLVLSPSQYRYLDNAQGNYVPFADEARYNRDHIVYKSPDGDAGPAKLTSTLYYPAGIGATCVLRDPYNKTILSQMFDDLNYTLSDEMIAKYYDDMCLLAVKHRKIYPHHIPKPDVSVSHSGPIQTYPMDHTMDYIQDDYDDISSDNSSIRFRIKEIPCVCAENGHGFYCPDNVGKPDPPSHKTITRDTLLDISGRNVSEYLLYTTDNFRLQRYGALTFGNVIPFVPPDFGSLVPIIYRKLAVRNAAIAWYNNKGYHSMPTFINALNNAILRANLDPNIHGNPSAYGITVINHPMNKTDSSLSAEYILRRTDVEVAIFIIVALSFVPASFVLYLVYERASRAKHLQFVSGVNPVVYWASNYTWDILNYFVPATCCIGILLLFDVRAYTSPTNMPAVILLFLLYGWSFTPMMYPASFFFDVPSTAYVFLIVFNLFIGITTVIASSFLELFSDDEQLRKIGDILHDVFMVFPNYCLGRGLMDIAYNDYFNEYYYKIGEFDKMRSPLEWELTARMLTIMAIEGLIFFGITVLCEYRFFFKPRKVMSRKDSVEEEEDSDVAEERQRVLRGEANNDLLKLVNLTKVYKNRKRGRLLAVDRLCLGVPQGECFGLLGVNGAGKTTTFKMLTGDELITSGNAFLNGHSILTDLRKVHQNIGYCPQFDAVFDELTAREHLLLYARLRGIPYKEEDKVVDWALNKLALTQYADRPAGTYSGGNKRKLSTAIALVGHPPVIFMDEPTTGMDPHSRRFLWDLILSIIKDGRSVILTSHSMEECEALCTRLAIMVNGHFKCLGSIQHLKNRFGDGYTVTIRLKGSRPNLQPVMRYFMRAFPSAVLKEKHHNMIQYDLQADDMSLSNIFAEMKIMEDTFNIEDYSVSQTTLDNVFINFAKLQCDRRSDETLAIPQRSRVPSELEDLLGDENLADDNNEDPYSVGFDGVESHLAFNMEMV